MCLPTACNAICKYCTCDIKKESTLYLKELNIQVSNENMRFRMLFCIQSMNIAKDKLCVQLVCKYYDIQGKILKSKMILCKQKTSSFMSKRLIERTSIALL
jgi:hypothetical protein